MKNSIEYNGNVRITINKRSFRYTNTGTLQLFKVIANILSGNSNHRSDSLPGYISCIDKDTTSGTSETIVSQVLISNRTIQEDRSNTKVTLILAAMFTFSDKLKNPADDTTTALQLHDRTNERDILAEVVIDKDLIKQIEKGRSALIEWDLVFSNGGGTN